MPTLIPTERLFTAVEHKDLTAIRTAIVGGADINGRNGFGMTPLEAAALDGSEEVTDALLKAGCLIERINKVLHNSIVGGNLAVLEKILAKLQVATGIGSISERGRTPLMQAANCGRMDMCAALIKHGADTKVCTDVGRNVLSYALSEGPERSGETIFGITKLLLESETPVNPNNSPPLIRAVDLCLNNQKFIDDNLSSKLCELLIKHGADVNAVYEGYADYRGGTVFLLIASIRGRSESAGFDPNLIPLLVKNEANVNAVNYVGKTALHLAALADLEFITHPPSPRSFPG
jgi:ankyrin repeat protein